MRWVLRALGTSLLLAGIALLAWQATTRLSYRSLSHRAHAPLVVGREAAVGDTPDPTIDWSGLKGEGADLAAWLSIEGTDIDLPVMAARPDDTTYYLSHDPWGRWALEGTPFLDHRCKADGTHRLVFGHHLTTGGQFSMLQKAYMQDGFDKLGVCHWSTPQGGDRSAYPLLALRVDEWYEPIQHFDPLSCDALHELLRRLACDASARSGDWERMTDRSVAAVTLVTCSSDLVGQRWRTLVVFVETPD